jgi:predicted TPR repeat methyltransferase
MSTPVKASQLNQQQLEDLFSKACALHESGDLTRALVAYRELLTAIPNSALLHFNCGLALFENEDFTGAEEQYQLAVKSCPEDPDIHYNRGLNFRRLGRLQQGASSFKEAFRLGDTSIDTLYNLALCHQDMDEHQEASRLYDIILDQQPDHTSSLNNYAFLCHKTGNSQKAEELYSNLLLYNPQHQAAQHMLNSLKGETPETAPLEYVEAIFDNYAQGFEESLVGKLQYRTPHTLLELYLENVAEEMQHSCLDLGCGTGLAGVHFNPYCTTLTGIDISEEMLAVAREKQIYASLHKDDILGFLQADTTHYDLILAADVFTYMGDLQTLFRECASHASVGTYFLFSVEETASAAYVLKASGRFGHSQSYINAMAEKNNWHTIGHKHSRLRQDGGQWVMGHLFLLQK